MATVRYLVQDVAQAVEFYTRHLDFTLVEQFGPAFALVRRDDLNLWLSGPQSSAARPMPDGRAPAPGGWNRFVIELSGLHARVEALRAAGVTFRNEIISGPGGKQIVVVDPSGNPIELFERAA